MKAKYILKEHKLKAPVDLELILADIKVAGRSELQKLLTLRHKYQAAIKALNKPEPRPVKEVDPEEQIERELDEAIARIEKEKKRTAKKDREIKKKNDLR